MTERRRSESRGSADETMETAWKADTTPAERVTKVIQCQYTPIDVDTVADEALTTTETASKHLESLADEGFVAISQGPDGRPRYQRAAESVVIEHSRQLLESHSSEELATRVDEMQATIRDYRRTHGVDSPEALAAQLESEGRAMTDDTRVDDSVVTSWQTTRRNLAFARATLSISEAMEQVGGSR